MSTQKKIQSYKIIGQTNLLHLEFTDTSYAFPYKKAKFKKMLKVGVDYFESFLSRRSAHAGWPGLPKGVERVELHIQFVGASKIKSLNRDFRGKDYTTDVLSFALEEDLRQMEIAYSPYVNLGDIIVCREKALSQAKKFNISIEEEFIHLVVHGLFHLCGYDHEISLEEQKLMEKNEKKALEYIANNYNFID